MGCSLFCGGFVFFVLFRVSLGCGSVSLCEECVECAWANEVRIAQLAQAPV